MKTLQKYPFLTFVLGLAIGAGVMWARPQQGLNASSAHGNDKFSMVTVPYDGLNTTHVVFTLDHLTGVLSGGYLNRNGGFAHGYLHNVAADFNVNPATPDPKYAIVGAPFQGGGGRPQPANGVLYVGELTSGTVIAYSFAQRPASQASPLTIIARYPFRESAQ